MITFQLCICAAKPVCGSVEGERMALFSDLSRPIPFARRM
jgi:hypothetical protein